MWRWVMLVRRLFWISLAICLTAFDFWTVFWPHPPMNFGTNPVLLPVILVVFFGSGLAGLWMIFRAIVRREKNLWLILIGSITVPNLFIWYFFERYLPQKAAARRLASSGIAGTQTNHRPASDVR
jgi:O-antigen/teichoic acid export membrane protein